MAVDYLDLETRPVETPMQLSRSVPDVGSPPVVPVHPEPLVDLTDQAASYWVRRRRAEAAANR